MKTTLLLCLSLFIFKGDIMANSITVQATQDLGAISPLLYGVGIEWPEHGNGILDPSSGAVRSDVVNMLKPLRLHIAAFPRRHPGRPLQLARWSGGARDADLPVRIR